MSSAQARPSRQMSHQPILKEIVHRMGRHGDPTRPSFRELREQTQIKTSTMARQRQETRSQRLRVQRCDTEGSDW